LDSSVQHSTISDRYWRYDFHSFFLNHKNTEKLIVLFEEQGNSEYDFVARTATFNVGVPVIVSLDSNYYLPNIKGWYSPSFGNSYAVDYQIEDGCSAPLDARIAFRASSSVKVDDNYPFSISCFPNPSSKELNISYSLPENGNARIILYDLQGRVIRETTNNVGIGEHQIKWDVSQIPSGSYILGVITDKERKVEIINIIH
jgi:hypothetical protein